MLLRTTQQLEEWETLGPNWSLMNIPFPFENVVFFISTIYRTMNTMHHELRQQETKKLPCPRRRGLAWFQGSSDCCQDYRMLNALK